MEQKRLSTEQAARQESLERDVAALRSMLEKVTKMLFESRVPSCDPFGSIHSAVSLLCRDLCTITKASEGKKRLTRLMGVWLLPLLTCPQSKSVCK